MKSFKKTIFFNRDKEDNWELREKAERLNFLNSDDMLYLGYEVEIQLQIFEDGSNKILKINKINVSGLNIKL